MAPEKARIACLDVKYGYIPGNVDIAEALEVFTIRPSLFFNRGRNARVTSTGPNRLTSNVSENAFRVMNSIGPPSPPTPALLTMPQSSVRMKSIWFYVKWESLILKQWCEL